MARPLRKELPLHNEKFDLVIFLFKNLLQMKWLTSMPGIVEGNSALFQDSQYIREGAKMWIYFTSSLKFRKKVFYTITWIFIAFPLFLGFKYSYELFCYHILINSKYTITIYELWIQADAEQNATEAQLVINRSHVKCAQGALIFYSECVSVGLYLELGYLTTKTHTDFNI